MTGRRVDAATAVAAVGDDWSGLEGANILVTGGTGFVGRWLLETFVEANRCHELGARMLVVSRNPGRFAREAPWLAFDRAVELLRGDVRNFTVSERSLTHVIHAAAPADAALAQRYPSELESIIVEGTRRVLAVARDAGAKRVLVLSSGAVYGGVRDTRRPRLEAESTAAPADRESAYGEAKRLLERDVLDWATRCSVDAVVARLFAFVGPHLPVDRHFAIGNFIGDALDGGPVRVQGDGTPVRSYLYAGDMAAWLWKLLMRGGRGEAYNVGSERHLTIVEAAQLVARSVDPPVEVCIEGISQSGGGGAWYVPCTAKARNELGVAEWTCLERAIALTLAWHRQQPPASTRGSGFCRRADE